jgi:tetratricopeptide (TPR) repeat protein
MNWSWVRNRKLLFFLPVVLVALVSYSRDPKAKAQRHLDKGNKFFDKAKFPEASIMYRSALKQDFRLGEACYPPGLTGLKLAAYGDAARMLIRAVELQPENADAAAKLVNLYILAGLQDSQRSADLLKNAQDLAEKLVTKDPHSFHGHRLLGQVALIHQEIPGTVKALGAANHVSPLQPDIVPCYVQALAANKQFPEGEIAYQLINKEKSYSPIDDYLYYLYATRDRLDDAERLLKLKTDNPKNASYLLQLAGHYYVSRRRPEMDDVIRRLSNDRDYPEGHLRLREFATGDLEQARLQVEESIKLRPGLVVAREFLTRVYISRGDSGAALKAADDLIAIDPNNLPAHLARSSGLLGLGEHDKARDELSLIVKAYPQNVDARFQVGYLAWEQKDYKQPEQIFSDLHRANPSDPRGLVGVVETLASQKHMDPAIAVMNRAIDEPDRRDHRLFLANLLVRDEKYDQAIQIFQALLVKEPTSADLLLRLAESYRRKGDLNAAIDAFRRCSQAAPSDPAPLLQLGLLMEGIGRRDQAQPIYEQILRIKPDHAVALNNLAFIKAEEGIDLDQALTMGARQQPPASPDFADTLGWIYIKKNLPQEAENLFTDLVTRAPSHPTYYYHYGMALLQKGDNSLAPQQLEIAIKNNPPVGEKVEIQKMLQKL